MVVRKTERQQCGPRRAFVFVVTYASVAESVATGDQKYFLCGIEILHPALDPPLPVPLPVPLSSF